MAEATSEERVLADAILLHRPFPLASAIRRVLLEAGEWVPDEEEELLWDYVDAIAIDMLLDGFRYVTRDEKPLLGIGPLEVFEDAETHALLTRCAVWYGEEARLEWRRRGGA